MLIFLFAALLPVATPAPTPPPIIITTKSSPLCDAVRDVVAPAVAGLVSQDRQIAHDYELLGDMGHDGDRFTLDNIHLGNDVYQLAARNIKIHQALDQMAVFQTDDSRIAADVARLRVKLLNVADAQAGTLNVMSGIAQTNDLADIARVGNDIAEMVDADRGAVGNPPRDGVSLQGLTTNVQPKTLLGTFAQYDRRAQASAAEVLPALLPVISRCR